MQLDEFVRTTLEQIITGVSAAQAVATGHEAAINPRVRSAPTGRALHHTGAIIQDVEFDVAITVSESEKTGAGLRVGVPWISGTVQGGSDSQQSQASRIRFVVPIALPPQAKQGETQQGH